MLARSSSYQRFHFPISSHEGAVPIQGRRKQQPTGPIPGTDNCPQQANRRRSETTNSSSSQAHPYALFRHHTLPSELPSQRLSQSNRYYRQTWVWPRSRPRATDSLSQVAGFAKRVDALWPAAGWAGSAVVCSLVPLQRMDWIRNTQQ